MEDGKKKSTEAKSSGKPNYKIFSVIFADLLIVAIIADVYFMLYDIENLIPIIIMSVVVIVLATMLVLCILGIIGDNKKMNNAYYNNEMKAQRAIYLMMKKNHGVVEESQKSTGDVLAQLSREIVLNQKASSKIVVSRNKENTDALMNSNDIIIEKLVNLLAELKENQNVTAEQNEKMSTLADAMSGQIDPASKDDVAAILDKLNAVTASLENGVQVAGTAAPLGNEGFEAEPDMEDFPDLDALMPEEPVEEAEDLPDLDNLMPEEEPITDTEDTLDLDDFDLSGFEEDNGEVVLTGLDELMTEEAGNEEEDATEDLGDLDLDSLLSGLEDIPTDAEVAEEKPPMPDLSDPNKAMSPDEIAAMFANMAPAEEAPVPEPEPVAEASAPEPEPAPVPDMTATPVSMGDMNSNEKMTPEQIAELIANMGN